MFKDYKYSVISITHITYFFRFLLLSTSNVRMSEGTFCRVAVHIKVGFKGTCFLDAHGHYIGCYFVYSQTVPSSDDFFLLPRQKYSNMRNC